MSYDIPFTSIRHDNDGKLISISKFSLVTNIDFLGTINGEHKKDNPVESQKVLDFIIRLTRCSNEADRRIGYDLDSFSIDLAEMKENGHLNHACFNFLNYTRTTNVDKLELPAGVGKYVIKVLIKASEEDEYTIQAMSPIIVV